MPELYTWDIFLNTQSEKSGEKPVSAFGSRGEGGGGQISPLMHEDQSLSMKQNHLNCL